MAQTRKKQRPGERELVPVNLLLPVEVRNALQQEALRRRVDGEATRISVSAIIRDLISDWQAAR